VRIFGTTWQEEGEERRFEMKKGRFTEEQIIGILKQQEAGRKVPELARENGISAATINTWKSKYGGMEVSDAQKLKGLEDENRRLKVSVRGIHLVRVRGLRRKWRDAEQGRDSEHRHGIYEQRDDTARVLRQARRGDDYV
jgi:putative transposase